MANIKVSELPTATSFDDNDYTMIVQSNTTKKITRENMMTNFNYSTNETVCGKWIDGKPIYRKVLSGTTGNSAGEVNITHGITNLNRFIKIDGFTDESDQRMFPNFYRDFGQQYALCVYNANSTNITVTYGNSRTNKNFYLIVEYTKTSD